MSIILHSSGKVSTHSSITLLSIVETISAGVLGLVLVWNGYYWIFWSSMLLTPLVHFRSNLSTASGLRLMSLLDQKLNGPRFSTKMISSILGLSFLVALFWLTFVLSKEFEFSVSALSYLFFVFVSINVSSVFPLFVLTILLFVFGKVSNDPKEKTVAEPVDMNPVQTRLVLIAISVLIPGAVLALTATTVLIRAVATIPYLKIGIRRFFDNWITLLLKTDIMTEPEVFPGLPPSHILSFTSLKTSISGFEGTLSDRYLTYVSFAIFIPSIVYRLILKSSFWYYLPLIWVAARPRGLKRNSAGNLHWNALLVKTPVDMFAAIIASFGVVIFFARLWERDSYIKASRWAVKNDFPFYWPMLAAGVSPKNFDMWYLLPGLAALFSLIVFFWSWQTSIHVRVSGHQPSQISLWCIYKLNSAKNILSISTLVVGLLVLFLYFAETCELPAPLQSLSNYLNLASCPAE